MPPYDELVDLHRRLTARFTTLAKHRAGPVFFIEHGLARSEWSELLTLLREAAKRGAFPSGWSSFALPVLTCAAETGYKYRGTGTDFWPTFEQEIGVGLPANARVQVAETFRTYVSQLGGATPPSTPWAKWYRLIAWPVTHALLPLEFHRPLAAALSRLRVSLSGLDDQQVAEQVRAAAGATQGRYESLLEDAPAIARVVRALVLNDHCQLSPEIVARLREDLGRDRSASRDLATAQRVQVRALEAPRGRPSASVTAQPSKPGELLLILSGSSLTLSATLPPIDDDLRRMLRRRRFAPRLWGVSSPVPSEQLFSGFPFALRLHALPPVEAVLLGDISELQLAPEHVRALQIFELEARPPLLFSVPRASREGRQVRGRKLSSRGRYWVLLEAGAAGGAMGLRKHSAVGPYECWEADAGDDRGKGALARLGFEVEARPSVSIIWPAPLDASAGDRRLRVGEEVLFLSGSAPGGEVRLELGGQQARLGDGLLRVRVGRGRNELSLWEGRRRKRVTFHGLAAPPTAHRPACSLELEAPEPTIQALLAGRCALRLDARAALEGLALTLELEAVGRTTSAVMPLKPLPQTLLGDQEPWLTLLDEATRARLLGAQQAVLRARVGPLAAGEWSLQQRVRPCEWRGGELYTEAGPHPHGVVTLAAPAAPPRAAELHAPSDAVLLAPLGLDPAEYGPLAAFTSLCVAPERLALLPSLPERPRLLRQLTGEGNALGLVDVTEGYLRWALAESSSPTAELRRRQVAAELERWVTITCCGEVWGEREAATSEVTADPWQLLEAELLATGLGRDPSIELDPARAQMLARLAVDEIRKALPGLWSRWEQRVGLEDDFEALDLACGTAHQALALRLSPHSALAEELAQADPGAPAEEWQAALARVRGRAERHDLAPLLTPTNLTPMLLALEPTAISLSELAQELHGWARAAARALAGDVPSPDLLRAALALWAAPEVAAGLSWRAALEVLLAERALARATRYLALRARRGRATGDQP